MDPWRMSLKGRDIDGYASPCPPSAVHPNLIRNPHLETLKAGATRLLRPTWAEISLPALRRNFQRIRNLAAERQVMAVIKADAYGHGAVSVAKCLASSGVDWFGV